MKNLNSLNLLLIGFALISLAIIFTKVFKIPINNLLFGALVLACPLAHIFMMKGHSQQQTSSPLKKKGGDHRVKHHP